MLENLSHIMRVCLNNIAIFQLTLTFFIAFYILRTNESIKNAQFLIVICNFILQHIVLIVSFRRIGLSKGICSLWFRLANFCSKLLLHLILTLDVLLEFRKDDISCLLECCIWISLFFCKDYVLLRLNWLLLWTHFLN